MRSLVKRFPGLWRALAIAAIGAFLGCGKTEPPKTATPTVEVVEVEQKDVPIYSEWVGTLDGFINAQIKAQVTGYLIKRDYQEGAFVKKGQLLFEIDPRPFRAALDQARAQLANAEGQLAQAQANQVKTQLDVNRYTPLAKAQAVTQQDLDNAVQANLAAEAQVRAVRAQIDAAKAQVESSQLNLGFTRVVSLIDGIAGIAQAQIGDLVGPSGLLTTVSTVDPIKVYFPVSEQEYLNYVKENPDAEKRAAQEKKLALELILANGAVYPYKGTFSLADREVDPRTGTLRLQGLFPNPGNILRPGQFARVRIVTTTKKGALLLPQRAVTELQGSYQVAVVDPNNKVSMRPIKVGGRVGAQWIIEQGVKRGERVVAEGVQKVTQGMTVNPKPFEAAAEDKPAPQAPTASK